MTYQASVVPPVRSIYPGKTGYMLGTAGIPNTDPAIPAQEGTLASHATSSTIVIASQPGMHPSTQRQVIWRIFSTPSGSPPAGVSGLDLQASIDGKPGTFVTIDASTGVQNGTDVEIRSVQADNSASSGPDLQSTLKIVSAARYFQVYNSTGSPISAFIDICSQ
jgi:hypothetical protein